MLKNKTFNNVKKILKSFLGLMSFLKVIYSMKRVKAYTKHYKKFKARFYTRIEAIAVLH